MTAREVALSLDLASSLGRREQVIASYRDGLLLPVRQLCAERIARAPNPTDNAFDAGLVCMARQVLDLLAKDDERGRKSEPSCETCKNINRDDAAFCGGCRHGGMASWWDGKEEET